MSPEGGDVEAEVIIAVLNVDGGSEGVAIGDCGSCSFSTAEAPAIEVKGAGLAVFCTVWKVWQLLTEIGLAFPMTSFMVA